MSGKTNCKAITPTDLAGIDRLTFIYVDDGAALNIVNHGGLSNGDFAGLTGLTRLRLGFNRLTTLPADIFSGLSALTTLELNNNQLSTLPTGIFAGLTSLTTLNLSGNSLPTSLPASLFADVPRSAITLPTGTTINEIPTTVDTIADIDLIENGSPQTVDVADKFSDTGDTLTYTVESNNTATATVAVSGSTVTITPVAIGTADITVTAADTAGQTATQTLMVSVNAQETDPTDLCSRNAIVQRNILSEVSGKTNCKAITPTDLAGIDRLTFIYVDDGAALNIVNHGGLSNGDFAGLTGLTRLRLGFNRLTTLPADIFSGLSALTTLELNNNQLSTLPTGIFAGLTSLTTLNLSGNSLPTSLPASLFADVSRNAITLPTGTTVDYIPTTVGTIANITNLVENGSPQTVNVADKFSDTGDTLTYTVESNNTATATVEVSGSAITITPVAIGTADITVTATDTADQTVTQAFMVSVNAQEADPTDLCLRTAVVKNVIISEVSGKTNCADITTAELAGVTELSFFGASLTGSSLRGSNLKSGDFAGLTGLTKLYLDFNEIATLPADIFSGLSALTLLRLENNQLSTLPSGIFAGLTSLTTLNLSSNSLPASLPASLFADVPRSAITLPTGTTINAAVPTTVGMIANITDLVENGSPQTVDVADKFSDPNDTLTYTVESNNTATATVEVSGSTVTITPVAIGTATITITATDTADQTATQTLMVSVNAQDADPTDLCSRTAVVKNVIISEVSGKTNCADITTAELAGVTELSFFGASLTGSSLRGSNLKSGDFAGLTGLTKLYLDFNEIATLPADIFSALSALTLLRLENNQLSTLPSGIFAGLTSLTTLNLSSNSLPASLPASLFADVPRSAITLPTGTTINAAVPTTVGMIANITDLVESGSPQTVNVANKFSDTGDTLTYTVESNNTATATVEVSGSTITITPVAIGTATITITATDTADQTATQTLMVSVNAQDADPTDLCSRTAVVKNVIISEVSGKTNCADITTAELAGVTELSFFGASLTGSSLRGSNLKSGDFAGLTGLTKLYLDFNEIATLPADIFSGLSALTLLRLENNQLSTLPSGVFAGLTSLTTLNLSNNPLPTSLPASLFADVPRNAITLPTGTTINAAVPTTVGTIANITDLVENGSLQTVDVADKFSDPNDTLTYTVESNNTATTTVEVSGSTVTITPVAAGSATITVTATDTAGQTAIQTFAVTVVDTTPVAVPSISISPATVAATVGTAIANITIDSSGGAVDSYSISPTLTAGLTLDTATGAISGTPTATAPSRTYTITATNSAGTATAMVNITVNAAPVVNNPAPTIATVLGNIDLAVNAQPHTLNVANKFSDPDDTLTFSVQSDNTATASVDVSGNMVTITPIAIGTTTITVTAADTIGQTVTQTFMVTVISSPLPNPTVCMRHPKVQEVIIQKVHGKSRCEDITAADLAGITSLVHTGGFNSGNGKAPPKRSDFAGLTALAALDISSNTFIFGGLKTLPADLFQGLPALRSLSLTNNQLRTLPIGIFSGLSLSGLALSGNPWVSFPTNIFEELVGASQHTRNLIMGLAPINAALPVADGTIPAQSLARTADPLTVEVAAFFSDPGDTLTYTATSATPAIASVAISGSTLTITPVALGTTNIMVTARDTAGQPVTQTFVVTVSGDAAVVAAPNISINPSTLIATVGTAIADITIDSTTGGGGAVASYGIAPDIGNGLLFDANTGTISGTPTAVAEAISYIITATNSGGTATATVAITVNAAAVAVPIISISATTVTATVGSAIADITIDSTTGGGGAVASYGIAPDIGNGLLFDANTGTISGTPTAVAEAISYIITATNSGGTATATVAITVNAAAVAVPIISISATTVTATVGSAIADITIDSTTGGGGAVASYGIAPDIGNGLLFDANTGTISGTPTAVAEAISYIITATNSGGTATATVAITVNAAAVAVPIISISATTVTATVGTAIADITIDSTTGGGGAVTSYGIAPDIGNGLLFDANTGTISGTPTAVAEAISYIITATNSGGTATATVAITVNAAPVVNNPAPTIADVLGNIDLAVNAQPHTLNVAANFSDPDDTLTFSVQSDNTATASVDVLGNVVTITPIAIGTTTITVTAADTIGQTVTQTFMVSVNAQEADPTDLCSRSADVQARIIAAVSDKNACNEITAVDLESITALNFDGGIATFALNSPLKNGDFAGLTGLTILQLQGNSLTTLPADIFSGLSALQGLNLRDNQLSALPTGLFSGLTSLTFLSLEGNHPLPASLPASLFADVPRNAITLPTGTTINDIPTTVGTIANITNLVENGSPQTVDVANKFSDTGDTLTYTVESNNTATATVEVSGSTVTITPVAIGTATITVTATDTAGQTAIQTFTVSVVDTTPVAVPSISISTATVTATVGTAIADISITSSGGAVASYGIAPTLPEGLTLDTSNGTISGTPTAVSASTNYTITATNSSGLDTVTLTIVVNAAPVAVPNISISTATVTATVGSAIADITITSSGGAVASYGIAPTLPDGLTLDTSNGTISGTPTAVSTSTSYTITATNSSGTDTATLTITVNAVPVAVPSISISTNAVTATVGSAIANITITSSGGAVASYGIAPTLPDGLTLDTSNGTISGTPTAVSTSTSYTITATNSGGTDTVTLTIVITNINEAPVITSQNGVEVYELNLNENIQTVATIIATDVDANTTLFYSLVDRYDSPLYEITNDGVLKFKSAYIPDYEMPRGRRGNINLGKTRGYWVTVTVSDGSLTDEILIKVTTQDVNEAPTLTDTTLQISENSIDGANVGDITGQDPDTAAPNNSLTYSITGGNTNDAFAISNTGAITVNGDNKIDFETTETYTLTVRVADGGSPALTDTATITINVNDVNEAPTIASTIADITNLVANGNPQTVDVADKFNDTDALTFSATSNNPNIASVSGSTTITITPVAAGSATITVTATDTANQTVTQTFVVSVSNPAVVPNPAPTTVGTIADITNLVANGNPQTVDVASNFNDTDALTFSATSNNPSIASVSDSTTITITPLAVGSATITITATDSAGQTVTQTFVVSVSNPIATNPAPTTVGTITDITNLVANGSPQTVDVAGKFNDTDALTFSAMSNNPNIASVSGSTTITITPLAVGTTTITVTATDTANQTVTQTFVVSVSNAIATNPAPTTVGTITDITNLVANGSPQTVDVAGKFNDTDALTFSAMSNNPNIASVSGSTTITITPLAVGTTTITVTATDTANQTVTQTFVVSVSNAIATNPAPTTVGTITDITNLVANGSPQTVDVAGKFNDTDALTFSAMSNNPNIASVSGSTTITITPLAVGTTTITVTATDTANQTVTQTFVVSVSNPAVVPNPAPTTVGTIADITNLVANGNPQTVDVTSNFNDTDALTFSVTSNNPNIASVSGSTTITITPLAAGSATITVTATDTADQTVTQTFVVSVSNPAVVPNLAPTTVGTITDITNLVANGNPQTVDVASNFNDTDALTFSAMSNNPSIASVSGSTTITITPLAVGTTTITVTATDTANQTVTQTFVVSVSNPIATNPAPTTVGTITDITNLVANGSPQTVDVASNFNDTDALTFSATSNNPNIASVSGSTTITITPLAVGTTTITVTATDTANQTVTQTFVVSVSNPIATNPAPTTVGTIADITNLVANGNPQTVDVTSNFNDTDALTFSVTSNNPNIASVSGSTTITITPVAAGSATITVTATDTADQTVTQTFVVSVSNPIATNPAPTTVGTIADITNLVANGNPQTVDVTGNFNDTDALTFSATSNNPSIASVSGSTTITITPLAVGTTTITVTATDTANQTVTQTFVVSVSNPIATNPAPTTVGTIADITNLVANGNPQTVDVASNFNDLNDTLTFSATSNNPNIASVSGSTTITITPLAVGTTTITVTATDTANQTVTQTFVVSVSNPAVVPNLAPTTVGTIADITNLVANGNPQTVDV